MGCSQLFWELKKAFSVWAVHIPARLLGWGSGFGFFFFFFSISQDSMLFFSKPVFAPLRLVADPAAADLVLSLHLNKHSCPDWQKRCLWFPRYLQRQGC